jgi:ribose transport system ATP-binding protein
MDEILVLKDISRAFPGVQALDGVSFGVTPGEVHALVGSNGAGKSTLMKILSGALAADAGEITFDGKAYAPKGPSAAIRAGVSTIYQELNLLPTRSVVANICAGKEPNRLGYLDDQAARTKAGEVLRLLKAEHVPLDATVGELKVSEKQAVEIAKALTNQCKLLIMDEPTAALNEAESEALFSTIAELKVQGVTILYVSHRLKEIFRIADTVTILRDGRHVRTVPVAQVTPDSLINDMIGRKISGVFPPKDQELGEEVLRLEAIGSGDILKEISFSLRRGEVVAITGLAGSGKVELVKALIGDWYIDSGEVYLHDEKYKPDPRRAKDARLGYMPEDRKKEGVLEELSVRRNISLPSLPRLSRWLGLIQFKREAAVAQQQVDGLDIRTPSLAQLVRNLSGGNQQKVSLAKWLATGSQILLLVEPTQGIDVGVKFEIYKLIHTLSSQGVAIILVSSEVSEIIGLAHRIVILFNGQVQAILDRAEQMNEEEILQYTFGQKKEKPAWTTTS